MNEKLQKSIKEKSSYTLSNRRYIHAHPEIGLQEKETAAFIRAELDKAGIPWIEASETGTIGIIEGNGDSSNVLVLRGDIDALKVEELADVEFKSECSGLMHACGHDAHTATLLSASLILNEKYKGKFDGKIFLLFQPGEETAAGAKAVINSGAVNCAKAFYGQHVWAYLKTGKAATRSGAFMTGARIFSIVFKGKSGHGSALEKTINPLLHASATVLALQTIVSNNISSLDTGVVCVGGISGGTQVNAICEECKIIGSTRFMTKAMDETLCKRIEDIAINTAKSYGCEAVVEYGGSISALCTDEKLTAIAKEALADILGDENIIDWPLELGSEDFSEYCNIAPVAFGLIGCRNDEIGANQTHHSSYFKIDEECLDSCVAGYVSFAEKYFGL